jgi:hypothetical protein
MPDARPGGPKAVLLACGVVLAAALAGVAAIDPRVQVGLFLALTGAAGIAYLVAVRVIPRLPDGSPGFLTLCLLLAVAWRLPLLAAPPLLSNDIYRYVWDGRVQRFGYNPYTSAPADPALQHLHTDVTRRTEHPTLPTIYPPAAELFFRGVAWAGESVLAFKTAFVVCDLAVMALLVWRLPALGQTRWWSLGYAWHPLATLEVAGSGHLDILGVLLLVGTATALASRRRLAASLLWSLAVAVKFLPLVLAPVAWRRVRVVHALAAAVALAGLYGWFWAGGPALPTGSLATYAEKWRFNGPLFSLVEGAAGLWTALAAPVVAGAIVAAVQRARQAPVDRAETWAWPIAATLAFMPAVYPWYLLWMVPFLTARQTAPLRVWTLVVILTYVVWHSELSGRGWTLPGWVMPVEYGAVLFTGLMAIRARRATRDHDEGAVSLSDQS